MRCNYPETMKYLNARKARHPRDDALEDYTEWTVLGQTVGEQPSTILPPGREAPAGPKPAPKGESHEEYIHRRCEEFMHKSLSSRRSMGGKFFAIGGPTADAFAYQVVG